MTLKESTALLKYQTHFIVSKKNIHKTNHVGSSSTIIVMQRYIEDITIGVEHLLSFIIMMKILTKVQGSAMINKNTNLLETSLIHTHKKKLKRVILGELSAN